MVALAQYSTAYPTLASGAAASAAVGVGLFLIVFYAIVIACGVLQLMSVYNWGTSDERYFSEGKSTKVLWFWLMFFVPFCGVIYFFAIRPKVNRAKKENGMNSGYQQPPMQGGWQQPQPPVQPPMAPQQQPMTQTSWTQTPPMQSQPMPSQPQV